MLKDQSHPATPGLYWRRWFPQAGEYLQVGTLQRLTAQMIARGRYQANFIRYSITPGFSAIQSYSRCAVRLLSWVCQYSRSQVFSRA